MAYLRYTQKAKLYGAPTKGFPLLFTDDGKVHWLSLNYFLELTRSNAVSSIKTYARHLQDLFSQLEAEEEVVELDFIDDDYLLAYKSALIDRDGDINSDNYASQIIRTVLHYCKWLEDNRYVRNLIGNTTNHKIRIDISGDGNIKHPLSKNRSKDKRASIAPRAGWIDIVKKYGPASSHVNARFELMIDWGRTVGLRALEACYLSISQLPSRETVEKAIETGVNVHILLTVTKGSRDKNIPINPLLLKKTWDYIDITRVEVVKKFKQRAKDKHSQYKEPTYIFLSEKTGFALSPVSFSNSVRQAFLAAIDSGELTEDERVWCHGLRHNFVVTLFKALDDKKVPRTEAVARQVSRHGSNDAMEPYLTDRFNESFHE